jgi:hypothetical protein
MPEYRYAIMIQSEGGRWFRFMTFDSALECDRVYQALLDAGAVRPIAQERYSVISVENPDQEGDGRGREDVGG